MNHGWRWMLVAVAAWMMSAGCSNNAQVIDASSGAPRQVDPVQDLVGSARPLIPDVPVPIGFSLDESQSRNYTIGSGRIIDHTYRGRADKIAVKQFYERQMVVQRWSLVSAMFVTGDVTMDFEKENERCHIVITRGSWLHPVEVKITVMTSARLQPYAGHKTN